MSAGSRTKVADVAEVGDGQARVVEVDGRSVAVFNVAGRFYAIDNVCPHRGGPLADGMLAGDQVVCPYHAFQYDGRTGECDPAGSCSVATYPIRVTGGKVEVTLGG